MLLVGRETVSPTIIKFAAFDGDVLGVGGVGVSGRWGRRRCGGGGGAVGRWRDNVDSVMGAMESRIASREPANAFLIAPFELGLEKGESPFGGRSQPEFVGGGGKESSKVHGSDRALRLRSSSSGVMVPYSLRRCSNIVNGVTSPNPKSGSSKALRNEGLTALRICDVSAARKLLYKATSSRASA